MSVSITCPRCRRTSYHPEDAAHGYCGACHAFTGVEGAAMGEPTKRGTRVTAVELGATSAAQTGTVEITDDYVVITDGTAHLAGVTKHANGTHVITVKGVRS